MNVSDLSDRDLTAELVARGVTVGPILPTTRRVYEKRLETLLAGKAGGDRAQPTSHQQVEYEEQDEVEDEPLPAYPERTPVRAERTSHTSYTSSYSSRPNTESSRTHTYQEERTPIVGTTTYSDNKPFSSGAFSDRPFSSGTSSFSTKSYSKTAATPYAEEPHPSSTIGSSLYSERPYSASTFSSARTYTDSPNPYTSIRSTINESRYSGGEYTSGLTRRPLSGATGSSRNDPRWSPPAAAPKRYIPFPLQILLVLLCIVLVYVIITRVIYASPIAELD